MADRIRRFAAWLLCGILLMPSLTVSAAGGQTQGAAGVVYRNPDTEYVVVMEDDAGLLTGEEQTALAEKMQEITAYGNAAFKTISDNASSTETYARRYYASLFQSRSGFLFLIDMDNRNIWIYCDGAVYKTVTESYADTITDNVYYYASAGDYYTCATRAFDQAHALLQGHRIAQPMKYVCNALLAVIAALLINFGLVSFFSGARKTEDSELLAHSLHYFSATDPTVCYQYQTKVYDPVESRSGSSGGGGGGGGRSSGGGGGHGF